MPNAPRFTRRQWMAAGAAMATLPAADAASPKRSKRHRALRIAHLTDVHVQPELSAGEGMAACLHHVQDRKDPPEFIIFGGDNVMNVDSPEGAGRAKVQLDLWNSVLRSECSLPYASAIGNHDILANHPVDGKQWAMDSFGLPHRCYVHDRAGWRFIFLDSVQPVGGGYTGGVDADQLEWLTYTLQDTPRELPVCIVSHIPILTVTSFYCTEDPAPDWRVPGSWMCQNARAVKDLFRFHPNVRLCLSGHMHMADCIDYLGVTYACNGAVSGGWWQGYHFEFAPGYALVDLYDDGDFHVEFTPYGWIADAQIPKGD